MSNNIDPELQTIKNNIYGHDIRMAIHDAIEKLWELAESKEPETTGIVAVQVVWKVQTTPFGGILGYLPLE